MSDVRRHLDARNGWIRLVNALLADAALAELEDAAEIEVFGPLRQAEARRATRKPGPGGADATTPEPAGVTEQAE